jgi:hypothetical protein
VKHKGDQEGDNDKQDSCGLKIHDCEPINWNCDLPIPNIVKLMAAIWRLTKMHIRDVLMVIELLSPLILLSERRRASSIFDRQTLQLCPLVVRAQHCDCTDKLAIVTILNRRSP